MFRIFAAVFRHYILLSHGSAWEWHNLHFQIFSLSACSIDSSIGTNSLYGYFRKMIVTGDPIEFVPFGRKLLDSCKSLRSETSAKPNSDSKTPESHPVKGSQFFLKAKRFSCVFRFFESGKHQMSTFSKKSTRLGKPSFGLATMLDCSKLFRPISSLLM